ncbi:MAG: membrane dipeptidase [Phycisphaerales bacterium]|nr:membrane dipeptidase [Phycisphaerales bacterium]
MLWFDAHLDLAYLAVNGRDMLAPLNPAATPHPPAAVTLPSLHEGGVRFALATIFTEPDGKDAEAYPAADPDRAFAVGRAQLEVYLTWRDRALIALDLPACLHIDKGLGQIRGGMGVSQLVNKSPAQRARELPQTILHTGILIENADPIRSPDDLAWWKARAGGVCAIGMAWAKPSRYAGGNSTNLGLTDLGRHLVRAMDALHIVHDASHLSDRAFHELCELTDKPIIASHSNCRALLGDPANQRHLTDAQIREIARRGGVIGLNLFSKFLSRDPARAPLSAALAHIDHICTLTGSRAHIGLGSDMDGGFAADRLPDGINTPRDLHALTDALRAAGWSHADIEAFQFGNWAAFWSSHPSSRG